MTGNIYLRLNGNPVEVSEPSGKETLLTTLRERLGISSVRYSCGIGVCGTCTVLLDGQAASACLLLTSMCPDRDIQTAEKLDVTMDPLEAQVVQAFEKVEAFQCSYCIPGFVITICSLLHEMPDASVEELKEQLGGNLCRCGTYPQIERALQSIVANQSRTALQR